MEISKVVKFNQSGFESGQIKLYEFWRCQVLIQFKISFNYKVSWGKSKMLAAVFVCLLFLEWDENKQDITRSDALSRLKQAVTFLFSFVFLLFYF